VIVLNCFACLVLYIGGVCLPYLQYLDSSKDQFLLLRNLYLALAVETNPAPESLFETKGRPLPSETWKYYKPNSEYTIQLQNILYSVTYKYP